MVSSLLIASIRHAAPAIAPAPLRGFARTRRVGMLMLLALLVLSLFVFPAILLTGRTAQFVTGVLTTLLLLTGVLAVAEHRRIVPALIVLSIPAIVVRWTEWIAQSPLLPAVSDLSTVLVLLVLAVAVGINVFGAGKAVVDRIIGAVVLYLLIGFAWAIAYAILNVHSTDAFTGAGSGAEFLWERWIYFSFTTLTTLGSGEIVPIARAAQLMTTLEALMGQLYTAVILTRLVSLRGRAWEQYTNEIR